MNQKHRSLKSALAAFLAFGITVSSLPAENLSIVHAEETSEIYTVSSPAQKTSASFWLDEDGAPMYTLSYGDKQVIEESALGFELHINDTTVTCNSGFTITDSQITSTDSHWENPFGDLKTVPDVYKELTLNCETAQGLPVDIICRAYDEGIAFRYSFPQNEETPVFQINQELTYFNLDDTATAYVHKNRNQTEAEKTPVIELTAVNGGYYRPLTVIGNGYAMSVTEANQVDYTRVHFTVEENSEPGTLRTFFNGTSDNVDLVAGNIKNEVSVDVSSQSFETSWRTFILGDSEGALVDHSYLVKNLNPSCALSDTSWITPGMAIRSGLTTEKAKTAIDFASSHGYEYVHFDAGWYGPEGKMESDPWTCIDGFDLDEISSYAEEKNIRLMVYINYRHLEDQYRKGTLNDMFQMYVDTWGIDGIKFGFVPVGSQASTKMVYEWVKIAADNHLIVDIHDEMLPTGYERTYPNLLTFEGIHGDEENPTPLDDLGYLFTRMTAGQADHTWCFNRSDRNTTKAFRIAGSLIYFSPLIFPYWYDDGSLGTMNTDGTGMWDAMPTTWDESHMLEAKIQKYATVARRSGEDWYLAAISACEHSLSIPLTMLKEGITYKAEIYTNSTSDIKKISVLTCLTDSADTLTAKLQSNHGCAVKLSPVDNDTDVSDIPVYQEETSAAKKLCNQIEALPEVTPSNLNEIRETVLALRNTYNGFDELQKVSVSNLYKLDAAEASIDRLLGAPVQSITINGEKLESFSPDTESYTLTLLGGASLPEISCYPYPESQITEIRQAESIPGSASVTVKNAFVEKTYTINFAIPDTTAEIYASDYEDYTADGRKEFKKDTDRSGGVLTLYNANGETETFIKGIGTHAATNIYFNIAGKGISRFQAVCGVSANNGKETNRVRFKVYKDSRTSENLLFDSENMTQKTPYKTIDVDTTGASVLILEANDGGDGISNDHANWCNARFILGEVFTTPLDEVIEAAQALLPSLPEDSAKSSLKETIARASAVKKAAKLTDQMVYSAAVELKKAIYEARNPQFAQLKALVDTCLKKKQEKNPDNIWEEFLKAFNEAQRTLASPYATDAAITSVCDALVRSSTVLLPESSTGDALRALLSTICQAYSELDLSTYTAESAQALTQAVASAQALLEDASPSEEDFKNAASGILNAAASLTFDTTDLETMIQAAQNTADIAKELSEDLKTLAGENKSAVAETLLLAETAKQMAITAQNMATAAEKEAKRSLLEILYHTYKDLSLSAYTPESQAALTNALAAAEPFLRQADAQPEAFVTAAESIMKAAASLVPDTTQMKEDSANTKAELDNTKAELNDAKTQLDDTKTQLDDAKAQLTAQKLTLDALAAQAVQTQKVAEEAKNAISELKDSLKTESGTFSEKTVIRSGKYFYQILNDTEGTAKLVGTADSALTKVTVCNSVILNGRSYKVSSIAASAFKNNQRITNAVIGSNVTQIGDRAFYGCTKLKKVTIKSKKLTEVGSNAFLGCKKLKSIIIKSKALKFVGKNALKQISKKAVIKVPAGSLQNYKKLFAKKGQSKTVKIKK